MVDNAIAEKDRDDIGTSKEENQFNFGAGTKSTRAGSIRANGSTRRTA